MILLSIDQFILIHYSLTKTVIGDNFLDQCFNDIIFRLGSWISHGSGRILEELVNF